MIRLFSSRLLSPSCVLLQLVEEVRNHAHVIAIDLGVLQNPGLFVLMVRRRMKAGRDAALRVRAAGRIARHLEREDTRHVRRKRERLQIEHQLDVFAERIRHADGRFRHLPRFTAGVA